MLDTGANAGLTVNRPKSEMNKTFQVLKALLHGKPYIKMKGTSQDPASLARGGSGKGAGGWHGDRCRAHPCEPTGYRIVYGNPTAHKSRMSGRVKAAGHCIPSSVWPT